MTDWRSSVRHQSPVAAVCAVAFTIGLAWALSNPPGAAPDEPSHYVRMVGLSQGDVLGTDLPDDFPLQSSRPPGPQLDRVRFEAGIFHIPGTAPPPEACTRFRPAEPWTCTLPPPVPGTIEAVSLHARVQPAPYAVPAVLSLLQDTTYRKLYLGRLGFILQNTVLVGLIAAAMRRVLRPPWQLNAALLSLVAPPLLAFQLGTLAPNGTETLAVGAFAAWLLVLLREPGVRLLAGTTALACVAVLTRDLGPLLVPSAALLAAAASPGWPGRLRSLGVRRLVVAGAAVAVAFLVAVVWRMVHSGSITGVDWSLGHIRHELWRLGAQARDSVALVGWLDVVLPRWFVMLWLLSLAVVVALRAGRSGRSWLLVALAVAMWVVLNVVLSVVIQATGFGNQARYTLALPLVLGLCLAAQPSTLRLRRSVEWTVVVAAGVLTAAAHLVLLVLNAQRHANGLNATPISFSNPVWTPPFGWAIPLAVSAAAAVGLCAVMVTGCGRALCRRPPPAPSHPPPT